MAIGFYSAKSEAWNGETWEYELLGDDGKVSGSATVTCVGDEGSSFGDEVVVGPVGRCLSFFYPTLQKIPQIPLAKPKPPHPL